MTPKDLTRKLVISWGGPEVFNLALRIGQSGNVVSEWNAPRHTIEGEIQNPGGWSRKVSLLLKDDGTIEPHCPCEKCQRFGLVCEHVVAVGLLEMLKASRPTKEEEAKSNAARFPAAALATKRTPVKVVLQAEFFEDDGRIDLFPQADLPIDNIASEQRFIVHGQTGYVYAGGEYFPMANVLPAPFHCLYSQDEIIERPAIPAFIRGSLPLLRRFSEVALSPSEDLFTFLPDTPHFRAEVVGSKVSIAIKAWAIYGKTEIPLLAPAAPDSICRPDPEDLLLYHMRNMKAESAALERIKRLGFEDHTLKGGSDGEIHSLQIVGEEAVLDFLGSGYPALERAGWKVRLSPKLGEYMDTLVSAVPVVTISDAPRGDFDVGYQFETADGRKLSHADIQLALNRKHSFVPLKNGRIALFDAGALVSMREVFSDTPSTEGSRPGSFRMSGIYAPYVRASLNAAGAEFEDDFAPEFKRASVERNRDENAKFEPVPLGALENTLRPYQKEGVYWMRFMEKSGLSGLLADEMGLGKTLQTLTWISLSRTDPGAAGKPALVVCPTSLVANWDAEAEKFVPWLKRLVISGADRREMFGKIPSADLVITSYALLQRDLEEAWLDKTFSIVVLDEAQHIKNRSTRNAKSAKSLAAVRKLVLTGTPVENSVADVWSIFDFLMPDYLGEYMHFKATCEEPIACGGAVGEAAQEKLRRKLHPFILRRLKKDVAKDLPDKIISVRYAPMTAEQQHWYHREAAAAKQKLGNMVKERGLAAAKFEILATLTRLRQIANDVSLLKEWREHNKKSPDVETSGKLDVFLELLDEAIDGGHRMLVFSQFTSELAIISDALRQKGVKFCYLDGSTKDRLGECRKFNTDTSINVFLISLLAGGTGLNLTGADMVVHFDPWWNPAAENQATDRAHRIGQKKTVHVVKLITSHTVEERVLAMQQKKQRVIDATVNASDSETISKMSFEDLQNLIR